ncbi:MAG TPA: PAS domain-containing protein, partial [Geobacteraceae bacterium]|nr:PAS domain-containing protein [Geobacteraceae bacterium]
MHESALQVKATRFSLVCMVALAFVLLAATLWQYGPLHHPDALRLPLHSWTSWGVLGGATGCIVALLLLGNKFLCRIRARRDRTEMLPQSWLLQTVINAIPAPIFFKDDAGVYLGCNEAFEKFIGLSRAQIIGQ